MKNGKGDTVIYLINNNAGTCSHNRENECLTWEKEGCQTDPTRQSYFSLHPRNSLNKERRRAR